MAQSTQSARFSINKADVNKWMTNALIFLGPALVAFMGALAVAVQQNAPKEGSWAIVAIAALYIINVATDFLKKFLAGPVK